METEIMNYGIAHDLVIFFFTAFLPGIKLKVWNSEQLKMLLYFFFTRGYLRKLYRDKWKNVSKDKPRSYSGSIFFFPIIDRIFNRVSKVNFVAIDTFIYEKRSLYNNILNIDRMNINRIS